MRGPRLFTTLCCLALGRACFTLALAVKREADFDSVRVHLPHSLNNQDGSPDKYFHEAFFGPHYDGRFAGNVLSYNVRRVALTLLAQTYLSTMDELGIETWIMHGSLIGWYWNRRILPWDSDVDVMIAERSIHHLAHSYNMTIHRFEIPASGERRSYLLEINPHYANGTIDGSNMIDARWIDTDTGLYIDITTLRRDTIAEAKGIDGAMMCKDSHRYIYDDIYPLRDSIFEGAPAKVPFAYVDILTEEYGDKALSRTSFLGHNFDAEKDEWIPIRTPVTNPGRRPLRGGHTRLKPVGPVVGPPAGNNTT